MDGFMFIYILLGLILGSFVSVVTYRIPKNLGFVTGRSFCDNCKKELKWYDNIPLFSFLIYLGKSNCCGKKISIRYPIIEIASALGFLFLYLSSQPAIYYILYTISLAIFVIDYEYQFIPDELTFICLFLSLSVLSFPNIVSGFLFSLFFLFLHLVTRGRGMGLGDVKLALPIGIFLGLEKGLTWLMISFILGGFVATLLLVTKNVNLKTKIAFGPFMIIAFWITVFFLN